MPGTAGRALHDPFYQRQHESLLTPLVTLEDLGREAVPRVYGTLSVTGPMRVSSRHFPGLPRISRSGITPSRKLRRSLEKRLQRAAEQGHQALVCSLQSYQGLLLF